MDDLKTIKKNKQTLFYIRKQEKKQLYSMEYREEFTEKWFKMYGFFHDKGQKTP